MSKEIINLLKNINFIEGKVIKCLLILMIAAMSKNAFGFGFVSLGSLTDGNQGYYLEYGIPIFFMPVGLHYESGDKKPSLFIGLLLPSCFIDAMKGYDFYCSFQVGYNERYHYRRVGLTTHTYKSNILINISYRDKIDSRGDPYESPDGRSSESILFGVSYFILPD